MPVNGNLADLVNVGYHHPREGSAVRVTFAAP